MRLWGKRTDDIAPWGCACLRLEYYVQLWEPGILTPLSFLNLGKIRKAVSCISMFAFFLFCINSFICLLFDLSCFTFKPSAFACVSGLGRGRRGVAPSPSRRRSRRFQAEFVAYVKRGFLQWATLYCDKLALRIEALQSARGAKDAVGWRACLLGVKVGSQAVCPEPTYTNLLRCKFDISVSAKNPQLSWKLKIIRHWFAMLWPRQSYLQSTIESIAWQILEGEIETLQHLNFWSEGAVIVVLIGRGHSCFIWLIPRPESAVFDQLPLRSPLNVLCFL